MQKQLAAARSFALSLASGVMVLGGGDPANAQTFEAIPWGESALAPESEQGISLRAQIDVLFQPVDGGPSVLMTNAFETAGSAGQNMSSEYVFEILNRAALAGLDQAVAKGAQSGRVNVVAVCYQFGLSDDGLHSLMPMGVFINTTDMQLLPDGKAAFRTNVRYIPPAGPTSGN